jgi:parallel beta-helix repeat protein
VTFSDNIIGNMTGTTGSITSPYGWTGIRLEDASNCIVTGNIIRGVRCGIADDFDSHGRNIITNNQILLKDPSVTYAVNGLYITSDNNTIMGNTVVVPSTVVNGTVGIFLYDASYNTISGNKFIDEGSSGQSVGMQEETAGCTHNLYMGNDVSSCDLPIALAGSSFSLIGNIGLATGLDPAASVISITSSGESLSVGNLVFLNSTGYFKTNAVSSAKMPAIAMATWSGSGGNVLLLQGYFTNASWSWTPGALLYASNSTAGGLTMTYPSNSGAQVEVVGYAVSATKIYFDPCLIIITIT